MGEVRLHLGAGVGLSEREMLTLRTFASAVRTAVRRVSALAAADEMARSSADAQRHDALTGLANRTGLQEHGERLLAQRRSVALVMFDIDRVRDVNESLGHGAGDVVLIEVARRLSTVAGPSDLVARLPGAVFAVMLGEVTSPLVARERAAALLESVSPPVDVGGVRVRVEAIAGLAEGPTGDLPAEEAAGAVADHPAPTGGSSAIVAIPATATATAVGVADPLTAATAAVAMAELLRRADVAMRLAKRGGPRVVRYENAHDPADLDALILGTWTPA
jgi:diguanylate cyclase (GGDEF)-like protein